MPFEITPTSQQVRKTSEKHSEDDHPMNRDLYNIVQQLMGWMTKNLMSIDQYWPCDHGTDDAISYQNESQQVPFLGSGKLNFMSFLFLFFNTLLQLVINQITSDEFSDLVQHPDVTPSATFFKAPGGFGSFVFGLSLACWSNFSWNHIGVCATALDVVLTRNSICQISPNSDSNQFGCWHWTSSTLCPFCWILDCGSLHTKGVLQRRHKDLMWQLWISMPWFHSLTISASPPLTSWRFADLWFSWPCTIPCAERSKLFWAVFHRSWNYSSWVFFFCCSSL